jgi:lipopolysaccharide export system permease protein
MSSIDVLREIKIKEDNQKKLIEENRVRRAVLAADLERILRGGPQHADWNRRSGIGENFFREIQGGTAIKKDRNLLNYRLEYYKKFSIPFGALSFVFLAVPLGLLAKKSGQTVGFIFGLIIAFIYWTMLLGGQTMGMRLGYSPFWSMWLPNILAVSIGSVMCIIRLRR